MVKLIISFNLLVGLVQCFWGYRFFKVILVLMGFMLGSMLAGQIGYGISGGRDTIGIFWGVVGGVAGAGLTVASYLIGVFLIGASLGGTLGSMLFALSNNVPEPVVMLLFLMVGGALAMLFQKVMIILSTSIVGAWMVVTGLAFLITNGIYPTNIEYFFSLEGRQLYVIMACSIVLGIAGFLVQYKSAYGTKDWKAGR